MNGRQAKHARAVAYAEAERQGLWKKGEASVYAKWWRKIVAKIFPSLRRKYADMVGRWYKRVLKGWARQVYANLHDRDQAAFLRAQKKIRKARIKKQLEANAAKRKEVLWT